MSARFIAARTAAAVASIWAQRPISLRAQRTGRCGPDGERLAVSARFVAGHGIKHEKVRR
jgi:hypothetical protein